MGVDWDLRDVPALQEDGSLGSMPRTALHTDKKSMERLEYKYYIGVSQIDINLYIECYFTNGRRYMMKVTHERIIVVDEEAVPESTTLQQEYDNLAVNDEELGEDSDDGDGAYLSGNISGQSESSLDGPKEPATQLLQASHGYYYSERLETAIPSAKRRKGTADADLLDSTELQNPTQRLSGIHPNVLTRSPEISASRATRRDPSASRVLEHSRERVANTSRYTTRSTASRIPSPQLNQSQGSSEPQESQVSA